MKFFVFTTLTVLALTTTFFCQKATSNVNLQNTLMSDLEADGLKGKVKQVIVESEYLQSHLDNLKKCFGTTMNAGRRISSVTNYDEKGNRTVREAYSDGKLFLRVFYDFLEGVRITKEQTIESDNVLRAAPLTAIANQNSNKPKDGRFNYKLLYKFDENGNRIEEIWVSNTGNIWIKDTVVFDKNNRVIEQVRRHRGEEKASSTVKLFYDDNGNLKQEIYFDSSGEESEKHYSYEFDSKVNWIKHTVSKQTTYNPKGVFEPFLVTYRKITYF